MVQRGLVRFEEAGPNQVGITGMGDEQPLWPGEDGGQAGGSPLDPIFQSTSWTRDDVRTLSSLATFLIAVIALWEVVRDV